jgi:sulfate adenylyltransferase subunit 1
MAADLAAPPVELLRFATAGSVDDGKSTLVGRLLHDAKGLFEDQLDAVAVSSARRGRDGIDLSLVTDGLRAEREQGITIDVAYRYFATPRRSFIIADTPGHAQYTRNMVTGASNADVAVVLVDAVRGLTEQSRRHAAVAALLGIGHVVLAVNKMDLVDWSEACFDGIVAEADGMAAALGIGRLVAIPLSALAGDNVVERSANLAWYRGPSLLEHLETLALPADELAASPLRFPVQYVIRPPSTEGGRPVRHYAGTVAAGTLRPGQHVTVLPSGLTTTVTAVEDGDGALDVAAAGRSVRVRVGDDLDLRRGDVIVAGGEPRVGRRHTATLCWFDRTPLTAGRRVLVKSGTTTTRATVRSLEDRLDLESLARRPGAERFAMNDIGTVTIATADDLVTDPYTRNRTTGSLILVDPDTNATLAAGMLA